MLIVPLQAVPSQTVTALLSNQATTLNIYQKSQAGQTDPGLYMDVLLNGSLVVGGVLCLNANIIIRDAYFGYTGDFAFLDTQGLDDPVYTGVGTRWLLGYFLPSELASFGLS